MSPVEWGLAVAVPVLVALLWVRSRMGRPAPAEAYQEARRAYQARGEG